MTFRAGRELVESDLIAAASQVVLLSRTAREQREALRQWASGGPARPAGRGQVLATLEDAAMHATFFKTIDHAH